MLQTNFKRFSFHWWTIVPSVIVLLLLVSVLAALLLYAGRNAGRAPYSPQLVADTYAQTIVELKTAVRDSHSDAFSLVHEVEQTFLRVRVPVDKLDTHLAAMIELQAFKRSLGSEPSSADKAALVRIIDAL